MTTRQQVVTDVAEAHARARRLQQTDAASRVEWVVATAQRCRQNRIHEKALVVESVASVARASLAERANSLHSTLARRVASYEATGAVPSLFKVMGLSGRELPYNRALAWVLDPLWAHGGSLPALKALATALDYSELAADLDSPGAHVEVRGELPWPEEVGNPTRPDLLVITRSAILLVENKVNSSESGANQYAGYLEAVQRLAAARGATWQAWLLAPEKRAVPPGWSGSTDHAHLSASLRSAASDQSNTAWGRIACLMVAEELLGRHDRDAALREGRALIARTSGRPQPRDVADFASILQRLPAPILPNGVSR